MSWSIPGRGRRSQITHFPLLRATEFDRLYCYQSVLNPGRHLVPETVIGGQVRLQTLGGAQYNEEIRRESGERDEGERDALREHNCHDADDAKDFRRDVLGERRDHRGDLIGLVDLFDQRAARALAKKTDRQLEHMTKGGANKIRLDVIRHRRAERVRGKRQEARAQAGQEEQDDGPEKGREHLVDRTRRNVVALMRLMYTVDRLLGVTIALRRLMGRAADLGVCCSCTFYGTLNKDPRYVVHGRPVNDRLYQFRRRCQRREQSDDDELATVRSGKAE